MQHTLKLLYHQFQMLTNYCGNLYRILCASNYHYLYFHKQRFVFIQIMSLTTSHIFNQQGSSRAKIEFEKIFFNAIAMLLLANFTIATSLLLARHFKQFFNLSCKIASLSSPQQKQDENRICQMSFTMIIQLGKYL